MTWLKLHTDIIDDPKLAELSPNVKWHFVLLMAYAKELNEGGKIRKTVDQIAWRIRSRCDYVSLTIQKLKSSGVVRDIVDGIEFVNWEKRQYDASYLRVRKHRENKNNDNADETHMKRPSNAGDNMNDAIKQIQITDTDTEKKTTLASHDKIVFDFSTFTFQNLTEDFKKRARESFPAVDVDAEINKAARWLEVNPSKRKKNYARFLTNWFSRTQERGGSVNGKGSNIPAPQEEHITYTDINAYRRAKERGDKNISLSHELRAKYPGE